MFVDQYHVLHTCLFCCLYPLVSINREGFVGRWWFTAICPLFIIKGIDAKMNKHTILPLNLCPLVNTGFVGRHRFCMRWLGKGMLGDQENNEKQEVYFHAGK